MMVQYFSSIEEACPEHPLDLFSTYTKKSVTLHYIYSLVCLK